MHAAHGTLPTEIDVGASVVDARDMWVVASWRWSQRGAGFLALLLCAAGCALYVEPTADPVSEGGGDDDEPGGSCDPDLYQACAESCWYSCDAPMRCVDGAVPRYDVTPMPCWAWQDQCEPVQELVCAAGCDVEGSTWLIGMGSVDDARMCAEYPTARLGDLCPRGEYECRPTRLERLASGELHQTYLECANGVCIEDPPPPTGIYLQPCDQTDPARLAPLVGSGRTGVVVANSRPCLVTDVAGCLYTAYTPSCVGDWNCPQGASCDDGLEFLSGSSSGLDGLCRPGLRDTPLPTEAMTRWRCEGDPEE